MTISPETISENRDGSKAAVQRVIPGTELALSFQRLSNLPRVPATAKNTVRGSRSRPVEHFPLAEPLPFDLPWEVV